MKLRNYIVKEESVNIAFVVVMAVVFSAFYWFGSMMLNNHHRNDDVITSHFSPYEGTVVLNYQMDEYPAETQFRVTSMIYKASIDDCVLWLEYYPEDNNDVGLSMRLSDTVLASSIDCPEALVQAIEEKKAEYNEALLLVNSNNAKHTIHTALYCVIIALAAAVISVLIIKATNGINNKKLKHVTLITIVVVAVVIQYFFYFVYLIKCK